MTAAADPKAAAVTSSPQSSQPTPADPSPAEHQKLDTTSDALHDGRPPRLAAGAELVGEFEESGLEESPYVIKRADGQLVQLPEILFRVAEQLNGESASYEQIAQAVTQATGTELGPGDVKVLAEEKLGELGLLEGGVPAGTPELKRDDPLLALNLKKAVVPGWVVRAATTIFYPLFFPPVMLGVLGGLVALDVWLFSTHGVAQSFRHLLNEPAILLLILACMVVGTVFHEFGHATACRYGGAKPGAMGVGLYIIWPAFYTDVNDAYRLGRWGRIRTDIGGVYFNAIFALAVAGVYFATGFEPLLLVIIGQHFQMLQQFMPFLRLDGYYVVSDLTGVPDLFARIGPIVRSMIPGRETDPKVAELKGWVRIVVTGWVLVTIPAILFVYVLLIMHVPRLISTGLQSFRRHAADFSQAAGAGEWSGAATEVVQLAMLVLPTIGATYVLVRTFKRFAVLGWSKTEGRPALRTGFAFAGVAAVFILAVSLWPDADYRPIRRDERGTLADATRTVARKTTRAALPEEAQPSPLPGSSPSPAPDGREPRSPREPGTPRQPAGETGSGTEPAPGAGAGAGTEPTAEPSPTPTPTPAP